MRCGVWRAGTRGTFVTQVNACCVASGGVVRRGGLVLTAVDNSTRCRGGSDDAAVPPLAACKNIAGVIEARATELRVES